VPEFEEAILERGMEEAAMEDVELFNDIHEVTQS
jgi:hypothetical protein